MGTNALPVHLELTPCREGNEVSFIPSYMTIFMLKQPLIRNTQVTGQVVTGSRNGDAYFFLQLRQSLWSCSSSSQPDQSHRHICPFSLTLPHEITLSGKGTPSQRKCRLPPSFVEKLTTISIQYHLGVNLRRGKFRPNDQYVN